jgi:ADP-ribose pyrophosphatase YjhB (NUDIX family)
METPQITLAVGGIVVRDGALLMIRRGREPNEGLWSIPGGRVEPGEFLSDAVKREVKEETGLEVEVGELIGILEVPSDDHFVILDYGVTPVDDSEPVAGDDAMEVRWVPLDEVASLDCTPRFVETLTGWGVLTEQN